MYSIEYYCLKARRWFSLPMLEAPDFFRVREWAEAYTRSQRRATRIVDDLGIEHGGFQP